MTLVSSCAEPGHSVYVASLLLQSGFADHTIITCCAASGITHT
jgi:hypothetical protein